VRGFKVMTTVVTVTAAALLATGCSSSVTSKPSPAQVSASASAKAAQLAAELRITPADGSKNVNPSDSIAISATDGKVTKVTVTTGSSDTPVAGTLSADGTSWHPTWPLHVSQTYTVTATGTGSGGQQVTKTSTFHTLTPGNTYQVQIYEGYQQSYGVGMPIMLTFSQPITNRAAVERSLEITTSKPVIGAWYWDGN
jgi:hypothetical protein